MAVSLRLLMSALIMGYLLAGCADIELELDLRDGTYNHNPVTLDTHPSNPPTHPNGEVEDRYFSPILRFPPVVLLPGVSGSKSHRVRIVFKDRDTGAPQYLVIDAKGTGFPFPETFATRLLGEPAHDTLGSGVTFYAPIPGLTRAIARGEVDMLLGGAFGDLDRNLYSVPVSCDLTDCDTGPHFPGGADLTDGMFIFNRLVIGISLEELERCSRRFPDCDGVHLNGISFHMLAGDILILGSVSE